MTPRKKLSRARLRNLAQRAKGLCEKCNLPAGGKSHCAHHAAESAFYARRWHREGHQHKLAVQLDGQETPSLPGF
jgi:hypothetical protein